MNFEALCDLMDGSGELAGAMASNEQRTARLVDQLRFQQEVLAEIHDLTDPRSNSPEMDLQMIRIKSQVAIRSVAQSGLLS